MIAKLLRLFDCALKFSKEDVMVEYDSYDDFDEEVEKLLLDKSIYPNGDKIGFYNYSPYSLDDIINSNDFKDELVDYIDSFSDNIFDLIIQFDIDGIKKEDFDSDDYEIKSLNDFNNYLEDILGNSYNKFLADIISKIINDKESVCDLYTEDGGILFNIKSDKLYAPNIKQNIVNLRNSIQNSNVQIIVL